MRDSSDIAILGSGPAAAAIAGECCRAGAAVTLIAPAPEARWEPSYCLWEDEVPQELRDSLEHRWAEVRVASPGRERTLPRAYAKLDNDAVQITAIKSHLGHLYGGSGAASMLSKTTSLSIFRSR